MDSEPYENVTIELLPTDIMISIFNNLILEDVMAIANAHISQQSQVAVADYYRRRFKRFYLHRSSLLENFHDTEPSTLDLAEKMLRAVGNQITSLTVDYTTFNLDIIYSLSKMIQVYCTSLEEAKIISMTNFLIAMPAFNSLRRLEVINCWFKLTYTVSSNLKTLVYSNYANGIVTDLSVLLHQFRLITNLNVKAYKISNRNFQHIASLQNLETLSVEILRPKYPIEKFALKQFCDVNKFVGMLLATENLKEFELVTPFFKKLSNNTVDTHIGALRQRVNVSLVATAFENLEPRYAYVVPSLRRLASLEVDDFLELREDLGMLNALRASISFEGQENMICLERLVQLDELKLVLTGHNKNRETHQAEDVLRSLHSGTNRLDCRLKSLELNAEYTTSVGEEILPSILDFVRIASKLSQLTIIYCTEELIAMKNQVENERPGLNVSFQ